MTPNDTRVVFALHTVVRFGHDGVLRGQVLAICIRADDITYEVAWWDGATRHTAWLSRAEVVADDASEPTTLGAYLEPGRALQYAPAADGHGMMEQ